MIIDEEIPSAVSREECQRIAELAQGKMALELGSWYGRSTVAIASTARILHAVDWHRGDPHAGPSDTLGPCVERLKRHNLMDKAVLHVGRNEAVLPLFRDRLFEFIFIDSFHSAPAVQADIDLVMRLLAPGGALAFHDYGLALVHSGIPFGVTEVVDRLAVRKGIKTELVRTLAVLKNVNP